MNFLKIKMIINMKNNKSFIHLLIVWSISIILLATLGEYNVFSIGVILYNLILGLSLGIIYNYINRGLFLSKLNHFRNFIRKYILAILLLCLAIVFTDKTRFFILGISAAFSIWLGFCCGKNSFFLTQKATERLTILLDKRRSSILYPALIIVILSPFTVFLFSEVNVSVSNNSLINWERRMNPQLATCLLNKASVLVNDYKKTKDKYVPEKYFAKELGEIPKKINIIDNKNIIGIKIWLTTNISGTSGLIIVVERKNESKKLEIDSVYKTTRLANSIYFYSSYVSVIAGTSFI